MQRFLVIAFSLTLLSYANGFTQQAPYGGTPWPVPGTVQAEDYDLGGEGVAYHDTDASNNGGQYRIAEGVDVEVCGEGGFNVGWVENGEWLEYTINAAAEGLYTIRIRAATQQAEGGTFRFSFDGADAGGDRHFPSTGAWQVYTWVEARGVHLNAGRQVMRVTIASTNPNVDRFVFAQEIDTQFPSCSLVSPEDGDDLEIGKTVTLRAEASDADGTVSKLEFFVNGSSAGSDASAPFEADWIPAGLGTVLVNAVATDNMGAMTSSDTAEVRVVPRDLPDGPNFSPEHGFYDSPFDCTVSWDSAGASIRYTLDGSDPATSRTAIEKPSPAVIRIDPADTTGRAATPAVAVRAVALVNGAAVTNAGAGTYIFTDKVKTQTHPGGDWPVGMVNQKILDYDMAPDVINDPRYKNLVSPSLLAIPSYCINTNLDNLFGEDSGIYVNPVGRGQEWERPVSIELIDPLKGEEGFQINAGLRLRGGYSRIPTGFMGQPKHAFRLFFRTEYGKGKLNYPLFQDEGVSSFDCVDLRTAQNYSWSYRGSSACIFIRDVFSRDTQRDMGQPYTRSRACHLYLNGMYWGLYQTQERPEASFAESYFGGDKDDYDVVKVSIASDDNPYNMPYDIEATDGYPDDYNRLWQACQTGFSQNEAYFKVQGRKADGSADWNEPVLVDVDNLADYLLVIYYTGNFDAPVTAFHGNTDPNNFYGIYDRLGRNGFMYFAHDAEHSLMDPRYSEYSDYGYDRTGPYPCGDQRNKFNPQWLHQRLSENAEYRVAFSDRVYRHFFNHGALTADACRARMAARRDEIDQAVIAESARWGDAKTWSGSLTRDDDWLPAVNWVMDEFFPGRGDIVLAQLMDDGLYPSIDPPVFRSGTEDLLDASWSAASGSALKLVNTNAGKTGTILFTVDGADPRLIGGGVNPASVDGGDEAEIPNQSTLVLKARVKNGNEWSALHELLIEAGSVQAGLAITEIHYHPLGEGEIDGREFEFLELKNRSGSVLSLSGARFTNGVDYMFPAGAELAAGEFWVIASNAGMFRSRYGFQADGEYTGQLDNGGERLCLEGASGDTLLNFRYNDKAPWPEEADSTGQSLVVRGFSTESDPDVSGYWTSSTAIHGSPGADDPSTGIEESDIRIPESFTLDQNYPNPFNPTTEIRFTLPRSSHVRLTVYDILGREAARLAEGHFPAGFYSVTWNASSHPAGVYVSRLEAGGIRLTRKLTLVK